MTKEKKPHKIDKHVGAMIRQRRHALNMSQAQLADAVGIKFQQIQKYEVGKNRVSASRLWDIAEALEVSIAFFFPNEHGKKMKNVKPLDRITREDIRLMQQLPGKERSGIRALLRTMVQA